MLEERTGEICSYEVWVYGYNKSHALTDFDEFINEFETKEEAVNFAKEFDLSKMPTYLTIPEDVVMLELVVEMVVEVRGTHLCENVEDVYQKQFELKGVINEKVFN